MNHAEVPSGLMGDDGNLIEVIATVHLGKRGNHLAPGEVAVVDPDDPRVRPLIDCGWLEPVGYRGQA